MTRLRPATFATLTMSLLLFASTCEAVRLIRSPPLETWVETTAEVVDVNKVRSSSRYSPPREDVNVLYRYRYLGNEYNGSRISFSGSVSTSGGSKDWAGYLALLKARNEPVPCYVNPETPSEAVLTRESSRWSLTTCLSLAVGSGIALVILVKRSKLLVYDATETDSQLII